jgi:hypothetical protein
MAKKGRNIGRRMFGRRDDDIKEATGNVTGTRKVSKRIEDALSEAMDFLSDNPTETSRNIPKDPAIPRGTRFISTPDSIYDEGFPRDLRAKQFATQKFTLGGRVEKDGGRIGDVRDNPNRGKTY